MRISDWSSDVCSSDLGAAGQREIPEGDRDDALAADLALQPLHEEAHGEHRLPGEADHKHDLLFDRQVLEHVQGRLLHLSRIEAAGRAADEPYHADPVGDTHHDGKSVVYGKSVTVREDPGDD